MHKIGIARNKTAFHFELKKGFWGDRNLSLAPGRAKGSTAVADGEIITAKIFHAGCEAANGGRNVIDRGQQLGITFTPCIGRITMRKLLLLSFAVALTCAPLAWADTVYTNSTAFFTAISGLSSTIENYGSGYVDGQPIPNGFSQNGIIYSQFNLTQGATQGIITNQYNSFTGLSLGADHTALGSAFTYFLPTEGATISFATPITAFGMFFNVNLNSGQYGFLYGNGEAFTDSVAYDTSTFVFVGVVSDTPFSSLTFSSTDAALGVYNVPEVVYASGTAVPEPSSILLLGTSLVGAFGAIRRKLNG